MGALRSVAEDYHELTKYTPASIRSGPGLDWSRQPDHFKEIVSRQRTPMRAWLPFATPGPTESPPPGAVDRDPETLGLGQLSRLLFFTNGITAAIRFGDGRSHYLRAAPSAGALYPTEIYVATRGIAGLQDGLHNYQPGPHELVLLWEGDRFGELAHACGDPHAMDGAHACVLFTGLLWRSAWRYQERGYRRVLLDTGHVLANLLAYAPHEECLATPLQGFLDAELNGLFFFEETVEAVLACAPIRPIGADVATPPLWRSEGLEGPQPPLRAVPMRASEDLRGSATVALHRASSCREPAPAGPAPVPAAAGDRGAIPLAAPGGPLPDLPRAILRRRSAREYKDGSIPLATLARVLSFALSAGEPEAVRAATHRAGLLDVHLVAFAVEGLDAGVYRVEGVAEGLLPLQLGDLREDLAHLSLGQEIARRCAAAVVFSADAQAAVARWGDRAYRYLHLEAGAIGERLQVAAGALELAACGIGGFFDEDACKLVERGPDDWVCYLVTIGPTETGAA